MHTRLCQYHSCVLGIQVHRSSDTCWCHPHRLHHSDKDANHNHPHSLHRSHHETLVNRCIQIHPLSVYKCHCWGRVHQYSLWCDDCSPLLRNQVGTDICSHSAHLHTQRGHLHMVHFHTRWCPLDRCTAPCQVQSHILRIQQTHKHCTAHHSPSQCTALLPVNTNTHSHPLYPHMSPHFDRVKIHTCQMNRNRIYLEKER